MSNIDKNYEDFLKSLQEDNSGAQESFPFNEDFDIENFIKTTEAPAQESTQTTPQNIPTQTIAQNTAEMAMPSASDQINSLTNDEGEQVNFKANEDKNYSIKRLEEKLSDLQQRFNAVNTAKEEESAFAGELNKINTEEEPKTEPIKSDEEFFSNISSAIQTLKGSLDNIVNTRLRYEENLIRQDQTLISSLREKTTRLKAINLALNSEVKRAKNEKLEYLRKTAEQTKELLSLRMQLSHAEERTKQDDFKVSNLEQQISLLTQEKSLLDDEIAKMRQDKLTYLRDSAEQTRNIMQLRHQLTTKEEALKQEEVKTNFLEQQLKTVEAAHQTLKQERQNSGLNTTETERTLLLQKDEINSLNAQLNQSRAELAQKSAEATNLRQQLLNLQFAPGQNKNEMDAFAVKQEELMAPLKLSQQEHERQIAFLRAEQSAELQRLRSKALQEENALRSELQTAEAKFHQEETLVNSLRMQIKTLESNLNSLEQEKANYKGQSENLTKELDSIRDNNRAELENLKDSLKRAQNSYDKQQELYNTLEAQYQNTQREKYYLGEELKKMITQKDNALLQNERYLAEIEKLKNDQNDLTKNLKAEIQNLLATKNQLTQEIDALKQNSAAASRIQQARNNLQEKDITLEALKIQMMALLTSRSNTDNEILEAREERVNLLNKLEEQTKQLAAFQANYKNEITSLAQEKAKEQVEAEYKIKNLEEKLKEDQVLISALKAQIKNANAKAISVRNEEDELLTEERLKNLQLVRDLEQAQKVFNQDTYLLEELKNEYSKLQDRNNVLENELAKVSQENKLINEERQGYKQQIADLQQQLENTKAELKQGQEFTKQLSEQITKLKTVNTALNAALKQMQQEKIAALNATVQQTKEILDLKEQLKRVQTDSNSLNFGQGIITLNAEHEAKIKELEEELKRVSEVCASQTKEINDIKTDNLHLKNIAEEKLLLQNRFNALQRNINLLTKELDTYKESSEKNALLKAKSTALTVQLERVNKEKENLKQQLEAAQIELQNATERERKTTQELEALRKTLEQNANNISKIKEEIKPLAQNITLTKIANTQQTPAQSAEDTFTEETLNKAFEDTKTDTFTLENTSTETNTKIQQEEPKVFLSNIDEKKPLNISLPSDTPDNKKTSDSFQRDILADYDADEKENQTQNTETLSFLEDSMPIQTVEEVYLPGQQANLASIFDDENNMTGPQELTNEERKVVIEEIKPTDVNKITDTNQSSKEKIVNELQLSEDENAYTDHSIRRSVVNRRPYARNPLTTFRKDEEYSDFLKKTKSLFYRIKWSLFKD